MCMGSHSAGSSHLATVRENLKNLSRKMGFSLLLGIPAILGTALGATVENKRTCTRKEGKLSENNVLQGRSP